MYRLGTKPASFRCHLNLLCGFVIHRVTVVHTLGNSVVFACTCDFQRGNIRAMIEDGSQDVAAQQIFYRLSGPFAYPLMLVWI